jgi:predicted dehydrogenase
MPVRLGFVGAGGIAGHHMRTLAQIEGVQLAAFCDPVVEKAGTAAATYGGQAYPDAVRMYDDARLDAVYVCVPPFAHEHQELEAIRRGLHLFVEKPVATTAAKAEEILAAIRQRRLVSAVGYHWRYMDTTTRARERLGQQPVGFALGSWTGGMPGVSWWRVMRESGGQMVEQTTHIFDLARFLVGEVRSVHACARTGLMASVEHYDVHDASVTNLAFANGAIGSITSACMLTAGGHVGLDLYQKEQVLRLDGRTLTVDRPDGREILNLGNNPTLVEDTAFVRAVESGDTSGILSDYADAVKSLKLTLAATRSAVEGRAVEL